MVADQEAFGIYKTVRHYALEGLDDLIQVLMENTDDALFELSDKVDNDRERNLYFEAMREVRAKREAMQQTFRQEMRKALDERFEGAKKESFFDEDEELTLVEIDEMEDSIAITNMIKRARPQFEDDLFAMSVRLKTLMHMKSLEADENPLDPKTICESFHQAAGALETDVKAKLIFYKLFEQQVMHNLSRFYKGINDLLINKGILPELNVEKERQQQTTRFMANRPERSTTETPVVEPNQPELSPGSLTSDGNVIQAQNLFSMLQQAVGGPASSGPVGGGVPGGGGMPQGGGGGEVFEPMGGVVVNTAPAQMVAGLSTLQATNLNAAPAISASPLEARQGLQQQLGVFRAEYAADASAADKQLIDVISMLFDYFFDDAELPDPIKVLIGRLQIPILKAAMLDKDFFNQKKHPARRFLDQVSHASLGWTEQQDEAPLVGKIEEIVNFILTEFVDDTAVFQQACDQLDNYLADESQQSKASEDKIVAEEQSREDQIRKARQVSSRLIDKLVEGRQLSHEVVDFLQTTWSSVLFSALLSLGEDSVHWKNLKRISTVFVWTLIPKNTEEERKRILKTIPPLLRALSKGMDLINIGKEVQNRLFAMLAQEHAKIVKETTKNIVTRVDDITVWPENPDFIAASTLETIDDKDSIDLEFNVDQSTGEMAVVQNDPSESVSYISTKKTSEVVEELDEFSSGVKDGSIQVDEEIVMQTEEIEVTHAADSGSDDFYEQAQAMQVGDWISFVDSQVGSQVARLSWKSNVTGAYMFVNRHGAKVKNLTLNSLTVELRAGRVRPLENSSVFDRTIFKIMSELKR